MNTKPVITILLAVGCLLSGGCSTAPFDSSPLAITSGDLSLVQTACSPVPTKGMDLCRVHSGDPVSSTWNIYVPWTEDALSAEVRIKRGDMVKIYKTADFILAIDWQDIFGDKWNQSSAGLVQALATVKYKDKVVQALGYAFIVVLQPGFDPIPTSTYGSLLYRNCSITYTVSGRSSVVCK